MSQFKVDRNEASGQLTLSFHGQIDEDASFEGLTLDGAQQIELDLNGVESINSCGIREWIKWIRSAPAGSKISYQRCPKVIVDQINMVAGFLPENAKVASFYVPYFNEDSGSEKMVLFSEGKEYQSGNVMPPQEVKDDDTGEAMEMDVIEAKYFKFLKG